MPDHANPYESPRTAPDGNKRGQRQLFEGLFLGFFCVIAIGLMLLIGVVVFALSITPPPPTRIYQLILLVEGILGFSAYQLFKGARRALTRSEQ